MPARPCLARNARRRCAGRLLLPLALALLGGRLAGQDDAWKVTADGGYASARVFRGIVRSGDALQASADVGSSDFHAGVWTSRALSGDGADETDLKASAVIRVNEELSLEPGVTHYLFDRTGPGATRESTEVGLRAAWTTGRGWTASVAGYHDFRLGADTVEVASGYSVPLTTLGAFLELNAFAGRVRGDDVRPDAPGPEIHDTYSYYGADAQLPYRIPGYHTTLVLGAHFSGTVGRDPAWSPTGASGGARGWVTLAVKFDF